MIRLYKIPTGEAVIFEHHLFDTERVSFNLDGNIVIDNSDVYDINRVEIVEDNNCKISKIEDVILIPKLELQTKRIANNSDSIEAKWQGKSRLFLLFQPEVWLFLVKKKRRKFRDEFGENLFTTKKKKILHPAHLDGIKYPNSAYYAGVARNYLNEPYDTEFSMSSSPDEWFNIPVKSEQFFWKDDIFGFKHPVERDIPLDTNLFRYHANGYTNLSVPICFAVVIKNPNPNSLNPKMIGSYTHLIDMCITNTNILNERKLAFNIKNKT